ECSALSLHDALPILFGPQPPDALPDLDILEWSGGEFPAVDVLAGRTGYCADHHEPLLGSACNDCLCACSGIPRIDDPGCGAADYRSQDWQLAIHFAA